MSKSKKWINGLAKIVKSKEEEKERLRLGFGVLEDWTVTPLKENDEGKFKVTYLSQGGTFTVVNSSVLAYPLTTVIQVCMTVEELALGAEKAPKLVLVLIDPEQSEQNGFTAAETVWLYVTAALYLAPAVLVLVLTPFMYRLKRQLTLLHSASLILCVFLIFRTTLLLCLAAGAMAASSTAEFALADVAVWCEVAAVTLFSLQLWLILQQSGRLRPIQQLTHNSMMLLLFVLGNTLLLLIFVAFIVAYDATGNVDSGISSPITTCLGRIPTEQQFWTTRRIVRFTFELLLVVIAFGLGAWIVSLIAKLWGHSGQPIQEIAVLTLAVAILMLSHAIIAAIMLATGYNSFVFGLIMLYATELIPVTVFLCFTLWRYRQLLSSSAAALNRNPV